MIKYSSRLTIKIVNKRVLNKNTQESTYKKEIVSEINDTEELPDDIFLMNLKRIGYYQQKDP